MTVKVLRKYFTSFAILLALVTTSLFAQVNVDSRTLVIPYTKTAIQIDGDLSDWQSFQLHSLNSDNLIRGSQRENAADLSADFWLAWNESGLFFAIDIRDSSWSGTADDQQIWNADTAMLHIHAPSLPTGEAQQYFLLSSRDGNILISALQGSGIQFERKETNSIRASYSAREAGPLLEGYIPWSEINPEENRPPRGMELNLEIRDVDGNARKSISWVPVKAQADGSVSLSTAVFVEPEDKEALINGSNSAHYSTYANLVEISAVVTDTNNKYLENLNANDFIILEDGVPQKIRDVRFEQRPVTVCILMDRSGSMQYYMEESRTAITHFLRAMREEDRSMLVVFNHEIELLKDLDSSAEETIEALEDIHAVGDTAFYAAVYFGIRQIQHIREKKVLVVLSDGIDESQGIEQLFGANPTVRSLVEDAHRFGIAIYPVAFRISNSSAMGVLQELARETGGRVLRATSVGDLDAAYGEIAEELKSQYHITYQSDNQDMDGAWRSIEIVVKNTDAIVRAKPGYYAPGK